MDANVVVVVIGVIALVVIAPFALRRFRRTYDKVRSRHDREG